MRLLSLMLLTVPAWACLCSSWPTAREAWADSPMVFVGRVEQTNPGPVLGRYGDAAEQFARLRVLKAFKGVQAGQMVTLHQPITSCTGAFQDAGELLFYLHPSDDGKGWLAPGCHRTRSADSAADDLLFLETLPKSLERTRLSGQVDLYEESPEEGFRRQKPLAGVRVRISGKTGVTETRTDANGVYEVYGLPAGSYRVDIDVPSGTKIRFASRIGRESKPSPWSGDQQSVELSDRGSASVDFVLTVGDPAAINYKIPKRPR